MVGALWHCKRVGRHMDLVSGLNSAGARRIYVERSVWYQMSEHLSATVCASAFKLGTASHTTRLDASIDHHQFNGSHFLTSKDVVRGTLPYLSA